MEQGDPESGLSHFPFLARLEILPEWEAAARRFLETGGTVMVLGAPDTGKSTLGRYLLYRAYTAGEPVALIDLDLGQSHLGPPTALGLGLFPPRRPGDDSLFPEGLYFVGQTSPVGAVLEVAVGCRVLADLAADRGLTRIVVNTSGLVQGPAALRLKRSQAELLRPSLILGLQRIRELEPLLRGLGNQGEETSPLTRPGDLKSGGAGSPSHPETEMEESLFVPPPLAGGGKGEGGKLVTPTPTLPPQGGGSERPGAAQEDSGWTILRLPVSSRVQRRSPDERRSYREEAFRRYFRRGRRVLLPWRALRWEGLPWGMGETLSPRELQELSRRLQVRVLEGESQGRRVALLLAESPPEPLPAELGAAGEQVHWLSWPSLHWRLVGLLDGGRRTLALGLILPGPWDPAVLALWTPLDPDAARRVRFLKVGKTRVSLPGQELPHV